VHAPHTTLDPRPRLVPDDELSPEGFGQRGKRAVVGCRPEAAAAEDVGDVVVGKLVVDLLDDLLGPVPDGGDPLDRVAEDSQALGQPVRVGVERETADDSSPIATIADDPPLGTILDEWVPRATWRIRGDVRGGFPYFLIRRAPGAGARGRVTNRDTMGGRVRRGGRRPDLGNGRAARRDRNGAGRNGRGQLVERDRGAGPIRHHMRGLG
jgi:hypothetical protein